MKHKCRVIPKEEIMANRSSAYEFINFDNIMKQTAVEWLEEKLIDAGLQFTKGEALEIEQAKEMEKQQQGYSEGDMKLAFETGKNFQLIVENNFIEWIKKFKNK
jgi:hypothetical protein